ncbi:putative phage abortive infection protein [Lacibacter sp. MH-610]|uniref:putative phage abortive infection protein n=1 Tax=Lacibacter sp. MH-610 TaxID=3020883 RepID=UPI00389229FA
MLRITAITLLILGALLALWFLFLGDYFDGNILMPDKDKAKEIQPFFTGLVMPMVTLGSTLLVLENLRNTSRQNFSNNFLKLIDQHHKLVDNINTVVYGISTESNPSKGRAFFDDLAHRITIDYNWSSGGTRAVSNLDIKPNADIQVGESTGKDKLMKIYEYYFHVYQSDIGHYFRNLYRIVRYAERAPFSSKFKREHVKMLRAQLSNYELLLLAYNGLYDYGKKFHPLIEKYELIKTLNSEERVPPNWEKRIVDLEILKNNYPKFKLQHEKKPDDNVRH